MNLEESTGQGEFLPCLRHPPRSGSRQRPSLHLLPGQTDDARKPCFASYHSPWPTTSAPKPRKASCRSLLTRTSPSAVAANPQMTRKRRNTVEHHFGTIKHAMNQGHFLIERAALGARED